jgi:preprotein translocase subunit SecA
LRGQAEPPIAGSFALAVQAIRRGLGLRPFDVQILGALIMNYGGIAEMQTGEGKTLTAVMTVFHQALGGGVHVWTANDYLAKRDAAWMGPAYRLLGMDAQAITQTSSAAERRAAYQADVTYATANEAGFDFLRDQLSLEPRDLVQRPFRFALIDECDSILIDEARIPLVIAGGVQIPRELAYKMAAVVRSMHIGSGYFLDEYGRNSQFTDRGIARIESTTGCSNLFEPENLGLLTAAQDALHAHALLRRDVDYVVKNDRIELVDEFKGRIAQNRRWPAGLQTALEAKEGVPLKQQGRVLGSITLQNLVKQYPKICGMTGTAATQAAEFHEVYQLDVIAIPTNRPVIRVDEPDAIYGDKLSKERAIVEEIVRAHATGRPILVGTASVEESERLSKRVEREGVPHQVLNARNDEAEAAVIARAGELGAVTISTNMAGRGTDIPLGSDQVRELGGLYVIGTNRHEARRIDNQLRGRAGRQGDPGSTRFIVSLEDDLMLRYGIIEVLRDRREWMPGREIRAPWVRDGIATVQRIVEGQNLEIRRTLWKYEGLLETQRRDFQAKRTDVLFRRAPSLLEQAAPERWTALRERLGEETLRGLERLWTLHLMDDLWSDYLAAIAELRGGIHWVSWAGKDPVHTFLMEATFMFERLEDQLERELVEAFEREDVTSDSEPPAGFDRSSTWTYLINDQPWGSMQERWAAKVRETFRSWLGEK